MKVMTHAIDYAKFRSRSHDAAGFSARIMVRRCSNVHIDTKNTKYLWVDFVVHRCRDAVY